MRYTMSRGKAGVWFLLLCNIVSLLILRGSVAATDRNKDKEFYIVYLGDSRENEEHAAQSHLQLLSSLKGSEDEARESLVYSYTKSFNAFAAKLSQHEAQELSNLEEVVSVFPNRYHELLTTKSWDFIGFPQTARRNLKMENDIVMGLFDTEITPQSESFADKGFGPPPPKWKGTCAQYANFSGCNNKLTGARHFKLDGVHDPNDI